MDEDGQAKPTNLVIALEVPANTGYNKFKTSTQAKVLQRLLNVQAYRRGASARGVEAVIITATDGKVLASLKRLFPEWKEPRTTAERNEATVIISTEGRQVPQKAMFEAALADFGPTNDLRFTERGNIKATFQQPASAMACMAAQRIFVGGTAYRTHQPGASRPTTCSAWLHDLPRGTTAFELQAAMLEVKAAHWVVYHSPQGAGTAAWARVDFATEADRQAAACKYFQHQGRECRWSLDLVCVSCGSADHKGKDCSKAPKPAPRPTFGSASRPSQPPSGIRYSDAAKGPVVIPSAAPKPIKSTQTQQFSPAGPEAYIQATVDKAIAKAMENIAGIVERAVQTAMDKAMKTVLDGNDKMTIDSEARAAVHELRPEITSKALTVLGQECPQVLLKTKKSKKKAAGALPIAAAVLKAIAKETPIGQIRAGWTNRKPSTSEISSLAGPATDDPRSGFLVSSLPMSFGEDSAVPRTTGPSSEGPP